MSQPSELPPVGPYWPAIPGADYRYGFPLAPHLVDWLEQQPEDHLPEILAKLEAAAFKALVKVDLEWLNERTR